MQYKEMQLGEKYEKRIKVQSKNTTLSGKAKEVIIKIIED